MKVSLSTSTVGDSSDVIGLCVPVIFSDFRKNLLYKTLANDQAMIRQTVSRMFIIIPESCFCPVKFEEESPGEDGHPYRIQHTNKYVVQVAHRAGNKNRDFKSSLYKIRENQVSKVLTLSTSNSF
jgi:hypothetical protein